MTDRVAKTVRHLTEMGVNRLEDLEILILMSSHPTQEWDVARCVAASTMSAGAVGEALARLCKRGIIDSSRAEPPAYRLGARLDVAQLTDLAADYGRDRTLVVNTFFTCNLDSLRSFASAFRIRRS